MLVSLASSSSSASSRYLLLLACTLPRGDGGRGSPRPLTGASPGARRVFCYLYEA